MKKLVNDEYVEMTQEEINLIDMIRLQIREYGVIFDDGAVVSEEQPTDI